MAEWQHIALAWLPPKQRVELLLGSERLPSSSRCARTARSLVLVVELEVDESWHQKAMAVLHKEDPLIGRYCFVLALRSVREAMRRLIRQERLDRLVQLERELVQRVAAKKSSVPYNEVRMESAVHAGNGIAAMLLARGSGT